MTKVLMCDPPSGWKYGFPKPLPNEAVLEVNQNIGISDKFDVMVWLVENGYPQEEIDKCGKHFWLRHWEADLDE